MMCIEKGKTKKKMTKNIYSIQFKYVDCIENMEFTKKREKEISDTQKMTKISEKSGFSELALMTKVSFNSNEDEDNSKWNTHYKYAEEVMGKNGNIMSNNIFKIDKIKRISTDIF